MSQVQTSEQFMYCIVNMLSRTRRDGSIQRHCWKTDWMTADERGDSGRHISNGSYKNAALIACSYKDLHEFWDWQDWYEGHEDEYPTPILNNWLIVWIAGDVNRDEISRVVSY